MKQIKVATFLGDVLMRVTRGAVPVDGFMPPADNAAPEARQAVKPTARPRDSFSTESEFHAAIYPRWGNFR